MNETHDDQDSSSPTARAERRAFLSCGLSALVLAAVPKLRAAVPPATQGLRRSNRNVYGRRARAPG